MTPLFLSSTAEYNFLRVTFKTKIQCRSNSNITQCHSNTIKLKYKRMYTLYSIQCLSNSAENTLLSACPWPLKPITMPFKFTHKHKVIQIQAQTQRHSNTNTNTHVQNTEKTLLSACPWPLKPITLFVSSALCFRGKKFSSIKGTFNPHLEEKLPDILEMFRHIWNCLELVLLKSSSYGFKRRCRQ